MNDLNANEYANELQTKSQMKTENKQGKFWGLKCVGGLAAPTFEKGTVDR